MTRVTCIIPAYNAERYLAEAIRSVFEQTVSVEQIIVVNDGSTDRTLAQIPDNEERIVVVDQENRGPAAARNSGLRLAQSEFIAFLDADDLWEPTKIEKQLEILQHDSSIDCCVTMIKNFWIPELAKEEERFRDHVISAAQPGYLTQCLLARSNVFEKVGGFNETLGAADATDWFLRLRDLGYRCALHPEVLVRRRMHYTNRSRQIGELPRAVLPDLIWKSLQRKKEEHGCQE